MNEKINLMKQSANSLALANFGHLELTDFRLVQRCIGVSTRLFQSPGVPFSQVFPTSAERKAAYRLVENQSLAPANLVDSILEATIQRIREEEPATIVVPQDTSTISKTGTQAVSGLGPIGNSRTKGFLFHTSLVLNILGVPLGILQMDIWKRDQERKNKKRGDHQKKTIQEKESYKWIRPLSKIHAAIPAQTKVILVSDRESDIHEYFEACKEFHFSFVVRQSWNRKTSDGLLLSELANQTPFPPCIFEVKSKKQRNRRQAQVEIRAKLVTLIPRSDCKRYQNRKPFDVWAVLVKEINVPEDEEGIEWILYSDLPITKNEEALEVVKFYTFRWRIEEFHMVLKTGLNVERTNFREGENIQRQMLLAAPMAVKLLEITYMARKTPEMKAEIVFSKEEVFVIKKLGKIHGNKKLSLKKAVEIMAFRGGWMGRKADGPPGVRTLWRGFRLVQEIAQIFLQEKAR